MKTPTCALFGLCLFLSTFAFGQGLRTPPGSPAPTQKSLLEIWNKMGTLEMQLTATQASVASLKADNNILTSLLGSVGVNFAWKITSVDVPAFSNQKVGSYTSLAFEPDGQPAISYFGMTNGS